MSTQYSNYLSWAKKSSLVLFASSTLFLTACNGDNDNDNANAVSCSGSIAEIADCDSNFDTLYAAVDAAGLGSTLSGGEYTVFAPTDAAFNELFLALGVTPAEFLARADLADILTYHVLQGSVDASAAIALAGMMDNSSRTVETSNVEVTLIGQDLFINRSKVIIPNVVADNGIIHAIDKVLIPPSYFNIVETAQADGRFNTLVAAVIEAGLVNTLATTPDLTVFAPTDDAFAELIATNDSFNSAADILALTNLSDILQYHVLDSEVDAMTAIGLSGNTKTPLYAAVNLAISYSDPNLYINTSKVIVADVDASNGIVHAIDKVLLPPSANALSNTGVTIGALVTNLAGAASNAEFTTLLVALQQEGLDAALVGPGPFTVFAPTDAAFAEVGTVQEILALADLGDILKQHVINGSAVDSVSAFAANGSAVATLRAGTALNINIDMGVLKVGNAEVIITDVETSNGVIHVINAVITSP
ncbi:MAG: fasciclin domain-containing protein [Moritella sp.]|uniref:fasciclin domain-containing protein n=1 Tax=Moritella sp. TaxID=78556 RepID=UPI0029B9B364|nr:fasciclin domain-containing protein [Moritella sp.]MDX2321628.1 fasciclin domain-containing protein [Moritella sp.]